jgi:hypothetical protein
MVISFVETQHDRRAECPAYSNRRARGNCRSKATGAKHLAGQASAPAS